MEFYSSPDFFYRNDFLHTTILLVLLLLHVLNYYFLLFLLFSIDKFLNYFRKQPQGNPCADWLKILFL